MDARRDDDAEALAAVDSRLVGVYANKRMHDQLMLTELIVERERPRPHPSLNTAEHRAVDGDRGERVDVCRAAERVLSNLLISTAGLGPMSSPEAVTLSSARRPVSS